MPQGLRQFVAPLIRPVLPVLGVIDGLGFGQHRGHVFRDRLGGPIGGQRGVRLDLGPTSATTPTFTSPASPHSRST